MFTIDEDQHLPLIDKKPVSSIDGFSNPIWVVRLDNDSIVEANQAACQFLGYSAADLSGKRIHEILDAKGVQKIMSYCASIAETGSVLAPFHIGLVLAMKKDGSKEELDVWCDIIGHREGKFVYVLGTKPKNNQAEHH
jgi:PAS domain S-box-containing protein